MTGTSLLERMLDVLCNLFLYLAVGGIAVLICAYIFEIAARYFFGSPTSWANELVSIVLSLSVFFAMPRVAAEGGHVAVSLLEEALPGRAARMLKHVLFLVTALTCLAVAGIAATVALHQITSGMMTMGNHPVPKAILTSGIALGFGLSGLQYLAGASAGLKSGRAS